MLFTNEIKCVCCQLALHFAVSMCFAAAIAVDSSSFLCPILLNSPMKCQRSCLEGLLPLCAPHPTLWPQTGHHRACLDQPKGSLVTPAFRTLDSDSNETQEAQLQSISQSPGWQWCIMGVHPGLTPQQWGQPNGKEYATKEEVTEEQCRSWAGIAGK